MVVERVEQARIQGLLTEAISNLCRTGLTFKSEFCVEGLLGITLDNEDVVLVNIKETIGGVSSDRDALCDLTMPCSVTDTSLLLATNTFTDTPEDFSRTGLLDKDKQDAFQLTALDLNITSGYTNSDFEMLFDLSTTPAKKRELSPIYRNSPIGQDTVDQLLSKQVGEKEDVSDNQGLLLVKEESRYQLDAMSLAQSSIKEDLQLMTLDLTYATTHNETTTHTEETPLLNLKKAKLPCGICGRRFRSEGGLQKHTEKVHPTGTTDEELPLPLVKEPAQPLDLTVSRDVQDDQTLTISHQQPFTCVCSKIITDYETYIDHVTNCSKSRLTPCKSCVTCGKFFFSNAGYVKHKKLHIGAYRFHCSVCHKGFFDRTHMTAHMDSSHSKVRRYECDFCNKSFYWKHHLKRHKLSCTQQESLTELKNDEPVASTSHTVEATSTIHNLVSHSTVTNMDTGMTNLDPSTATLDPSTATLDPSTATLDPSTANLDPEFMDTDGVQDITWSIAS